MTNYKPTIGLEIHAELKTHTKMFCNSKNDLEERRPNVNVCPVCMGHPGTLPVINKEAVRHVLRVGVALNGTFADYTEFDRKNYFYPDIPKGYQISQYVHPLVSGGELNGVAITRVHLEEDTARSIHDQKTGESLVDFNRAGVPLMELVTEPVIHSAEDAGAFARELQLLLRYLGVSDADMEKGHMRVEANISIGIDGARGTKTEIKNLNSFRNMEKAVTFEIERQTTLLEKGEGVVQETRGWNEEKQETFSQRSKESSHDYRYFPDPDLPKLVLSEIPEFGEEKLKETLPELPWERRERLMGLGIKKEDADMYVANNLLYNLFEKARISSSRDMAQNGLVILSNLITSDIAGILKKQSFNELRIAPEALADVVHMIVAGEISSRGAKNILAILVGEGGSPREIAREQGLFQDNDPEVLEALLNDVIAENAGVVGEYKSGKSSALQFLVGQVMQKSHGSANPALVSEGLKKKIGS